MILGSTLKIEKTAVKELSIVEKDKIVDSNTKILQKSPVLYLENLVFGIKLFTNDKKWWIKIDEKTNWNKNLSEKSEAYEKNIQLLRIKKAYRKNMELLRIKTAYRKNIQLLRIKTKPIEGTYKYLE